MDNERIRLIAALREIAEMAANKRPADSHSAIDAATEPTELARGTVEYAISLASGNAQQNNIEECQRIIAELMIDATALTLPLAFLNVPRLMHPPSYDSADYRRYESAQKIFLGLQSSLRELADLLSDVTYIGSLAGKETY